MAERDPFTGDSRFPFSQGKGYDNGLWTNPHGDCHGGGGGPPVTIVAPIVNSGEYANTGATQTTTIDNQATGSLANSGDLTATVSVSNEGALTLTAGTLASPTFTNSGGVFLAGGTLSAFDSATNAATGVIAVNSDSSLLTPVYDNAGLTTVFAALRMDGAVDNQGAGSILLQYDASVKGVTTFTNDSTPPSQPKPPPGLGIAVGASFSAEAIVNTAGTISNSGSLQAGKIDNQAGGTLVNSGSLQAGKIDNQAGATLTNAGSLTAWWSLSNEGGLTQSKGDLITGALTNSADLFLAGGTLSACDSATNTGVFAVTGASSLLTSDYVNSGLTSVGGALTMDGAVDNEGAGSFLVQQDASVTGVTTFTNDSTSSQALEIAGGASFSTGKIVDTAGTISNSGSLTAWRIDNQAGATLDNSGALTANRSLRNEGTLVQSSGVLTTTKLSNSGDLFLAGGTLTATASATNTAKGVLAIISNVSLLTPDYVNRGQTSVGAALTMNGAVDNEGAGAFQVQTGASVAGVTTFTNDSASPGGLAIAMGASLTAGSIVNAAGTFTNAGETTAASLDNQAGATLVDAGTLTATASLGNEGTIDVSGGALNVADLTNDNSLSISNGGASVGNVYGTGDLILDGAASLAYTGTVGADQLLQFLKTGDSLTIADSGAAFGGAISGFAAGDQIVAAGANITSVTYTSGVDGGTLSLDAGSTVYQSLHLLGAGYSTASFELTHSGGDSTVTMV